MTRRTTLWAAAALLGIAVSAALAWTASQLATQHVGLSSEPLSVAAGLAPPAAPRNRAGRDQRRDDRRRHADTSKSPGVAPAPTASTATAPPSAPASTAAPAPAGPPPPVKPRDDSGGGGGFSSSGGSGGSQGPDD